MKDIRKKHIEKVASRIYMAVLETDLYGLPTDQDDINEMIVAAYFYGTKVGRGNALLKVKLDSAGESE